ELSSAPPSVAWFAEDWAQRARLSAEASFRRRLEARGAALLSAIVLGDSGSMTLALSRAVRDSGGTHLLVVSGLKVGFAAAAALSTGAVMSVGGTAAVLSVARRLDASAPRSWPRAARAARTLLGINVAIVVALWPLFAGTFGRGSLISPLANIVLVPVAAV